MDRSDRADNIAGSGGAFRKRFQVPEAAVTIADRINQKCHHDWIETFLVQHQLQPGRAAQPLS